MSWEFKVGHKVVLVDASWPADKHMTAGGIYQIEAMYENFLILVGVAKGNTSRGFYAKRFRPLVTDTQDWLKEVLEKPPQHQKQTVTA